MKKQFENIEYTSPHQYLESITTTVDCQVDLNLYEIDRSLTTEQMSVVGIRILNKELQEAYGNKKYLIRCCCKDTKFFEMPLGT